MLVGMGHPHIGHGRLALRIVIVLLVGHFIVHLRDVRAPIAHLKVLGKKQVNVTTDAESKASKIV